MSSFSTDRQASFPTRRIFSPSTFSSDGDSGYSWERDFPLELQETKPKAASVISITFDLTAAEKRSVYKVTEGRPRVPLHLTFKFAEPDTIVTVAGEGRQALLIRDVWRLVKFVGERLDYQYIPSVRTARSAREIVEEIVAGELNKLESNSRYGKAQALIDRLQRPVLKTISTTVTKSLREFLPTVRSVKVSITKEARHRALRRSCTVTVDDGVETNLQQKGDGVQSLAALSLMRHVSVLGAKGRQLVLKQAYSPTV
jgi:hypothetical protein